MGGLEDIELSLRASDVQEGEVVEIVGEITSKTKESRNGGTYVVFRVPVRRESGERAVLWLMQSEASKIKRACGSNLKDYVGVSLMLGVEEATDADGEAITRKDGTPLLNIVVRGVERK